MEGNWIEKEGATYIADTLRENIYLTDVVRSQVLMSQFSRTDIRQEMYFHLRMHNFFLVFGPGNQRPREKQPTLDGRLLLCHIFTHGKELHVHDTTPLLFFQNLADNRLGRDGADAICDMLYKNEFLLSLNLSGKTNSFFTKVPWQILLNFVVLLKSQGLLWVHFYVVFQVW